MLERGRSPRGAIIEIFNLKAAKTNWDIAHLWIAGYTPGGAYHRDIACDSTDKGAMNHPGRILREQIESGQEISPFIGVYDAFSATLAARHSPNLFYSGFGFAASHYGLPDIGYIAWSDIVQAAWRIRQILPSKKLLVDISMTDLSILRLPVT